MLKRSFDKIYITQQSGFLPVKKSDVYNFIIDQALCMEIKQYDQIVFDNLFRIFLTSAYEGCYQMLYDTNKRLGENEL